MVEPIVLEFKIDDIYIDNPLLSKNDLLKYDTEYIKKISFYSDLKIIFKTIKKTIKREDILMGNEFVVGKFIDQRKNKKERAFK